MSTANIFDFVWHKKIRNIKKEIRKISFINGISTTLFLFSVGPATVEIGGMKPVLSAGVQYPLRCTAKGIRNFWIKLKLSERIWITQRESVRQNEQEFLYILYYWIITSASSFWSGCQVVDRALRSSGSEVNISWPLQRKLLR